MKAEEQYFLDASTFQNHHGGMVRIGNHIYAGRGHNNGFPVCIEWKTGKVVWEKDRGPGRESAAVIAADGNLYFRYQDGTMALIGATPAGYEERGVFKPPHNDGPAWPHPAIQDKKLLPPFAGRADVFRHRRMRRVPAVNAEAKPATRFRDLSAGQWRSGLAAWLGWMFDGLDMHLYTLVATPFVAALLVTVSQPMPPVGSASVDHPGGVPGRLGVGRRVFRADRRSARAQPGAGPDDSDLRVFHRAVGSRAQTWWQLMIFRFLAALGIGGEWAVGASLLVGNLAEERGVRGLRRRCKARSTSACCSPASPAWSSSTKSRTALHLPGRRSCRP